MGWKGYATFSQVLESSLFIYMKFYILTLILVWLCWDLTVQPIIEQKRRHKILIGLKRPCPLKCVTVLALERPLAAKPLNAREATGKQVNTVNKRWEKQSIALLIHLNMTTVRSWGDTLLLPDLHLHWLNGQCLQESQLGGAEGGRLKVPPLCTSLTTTRPPRASMLCGSHPPWRTLAVISLQHFLNLLVPLFVFVVWLGHHLVLLELLLQLLFPLCWLIWMWG